MKTSFLPRPYRERRPAPDAVSEFHSEPTPGVLMPWDTEPEVTDSEQSPYEPFPQAAIRTK
jgi:hypothetical protein